MSARVLVVDDVLANVKLLEARLVAKRGLRLALWAKVEFTEK